MPNTRHFKLKDHVGVDDAGNLEPIQVVGVLVIQPTMRDGEVVDDPQTLEVKPIPGTRVVATRDPRIVDGLLASGNFDEIDAPSKKDLDAARKTTQPHREAAKAGELPEQQDTSDPAVVGGPSTEEVA